MSNLFNSEYLNDYMELVEDTESPRVYHIWAALTILGAALGRRSYFQLGNTKIFPNLYTVIVGTPATRKSTAVSTARSLISKATKIRIAPKDTAGQRQGLISAMQGGKMMEAAQVEEVVELADDSTLDSVFASGKKKSKVEVSEDADSVSDKHCMIAIESEFTGLIGQHNTSMLEFLISMFDGEDYQYQLKNSVTNLSNPLMSILAATNPTSLANALPQTSGGGGFLSRVILVYGSKKYKLVHRPSQFDEVVRARVEGVIGNAWYNMSGEFSESEEAIAFHKELYEKWSLEITDSRFAHYATRRPDHLLRVGMILAAARGSLVIEEEDYAEGHRILRATERGMPEALGEFGMNPLAQLKQSILEFVRVKVIVDLDEIHSQFHRDGKLEDIAEAVNDLGKSKQVRTFQDKSGHVKVAAEYGGLLDPESQILDLLFNQ